MAGTEGGVSKPPRSPRRFTEFEGACDGVLAIDDWKFAGDAVRALERLPKGSLGGCAGRGCCNDGFVNEVCVVGVDDAPKAERISALDLFG